MALPDRRPTPCTESGTRHLPAPGKNNWNIPAGISGIHTYPHPLATNCYVFTGRAGSLYCACYDEPEHTNHMFRLYGSRLECGFIRYPSLSPGERCAIGEFAISPHVGDWHVAARKYRTWADSWFRHQEPPLWVRRMKGW